MGFDILIKNGTIIDGTGGLRYKSDLGITDGKISAIGSLEEAEAGTVIDGTGLVVSPGFIDMHSHSDVTLLDDPLGESKAYQGITTEVVGNCGFSPYPIGVSGREGAENSYMSSRYPWTWTNLDGWADTLESKKIGINVAPQVGHSAIRAAVGLMEDRRPTPEELRKMQRLVSESIEQGAFSLSTGLTVAPSMYGDTDEIAALAEALAPFDGAFYVSHARVWAGNHVKAVEEAMEIGRRAGVPVQYSHMAIIDSRYYGTGEEMLAPIEKARSEGMDASYDVYPYTAAGTHLAQMVPTWLQEGGETTMLGRLRDPNEYRKALVDIKKGHFGGLQWEFDTFVISYVKTDANQEVVGKSVEEIASDRGQDPHETYLSLIEQEDNQVGCVIHNRVEEDVRYFLSNQMAMIGSDGNAISPTGVHSHERPHPRFYGTYPRILGRYVREQSLMSLEDAVRKMTSMPAARLRMKDRGVIKEGMIADLAIFNADEVIDRSTFEDPHQLSHGMSHVLINGQPIISDGISTGALPGKVVRRR